MIGPRNLPVLGQQGGESAHRSRLGSALFAADEYPRQVGADGGEDEGQLHLLLPDDGAEGVDGALCHVSGPFEVIAEGSR